MQRKVGILGMTPQDVSDLKAADKVREELKKKEKKPFAMEWAMGLRQ